MSTRSDANVGLLVEVAAVIEEGVQLPTEWGNAANCRGADDPDLFYPERGKTSGPAREFCEKCPVRAECLAWALSKRETFGIWGGTSDRQRRVLLRVLERMVGRPIRTRRQRREHANRDRGLTQAMGPLSNDLRNVI